MATSNAGSIAITRYARENLKTLMLMTKPTLRKFILTSSLLFTSLLLLSFYNKRNPSDAKPLFISIQEAIKKNSLGVSIKGLGGHSGYCVEMDIQNQTSDSLKVQLEAGRRFAAEDTSLQDLLVVKDEMIALSAGEKRKVKGYAFCCESTNGGPHAGSIYGIGRMTPTPWVKLAQFINKNNFPIDAVQNAVWVLSNGHPVASITAADLKLVQALRKKVAELSGSTDPWYSLTFENDTAMLFSGRAEKLEGEIDYMAHNSAIITVNVRNKNGQVVKTLLDKKSVGPGQYTTSILIDVKGWPKGEYTLYVYNGDSVIDSKKKFVL